MLSKEKIKLVKNLYEKKGRNESGLFLAEGKKNLIELLNSDFEIHKIYAGKLFYENYKKLFETKKLIEEKDFLVLNEDEIKKISTMENNPFGVAVVKQKGNIEIKNNGDEYILVLDEIKDPGNLGTIIRTADWYGIKKIICSENSVEFYNPKVINSTMGSFLRVQIFYTDLVEYFKKNNSNIQTYGTFLEGKNIHNVKFEKSGFIFIGNEGRGISHNLENIIKEKITIPKFGLSESLNAGIATGIILDNLRRNI